MAHSIEDSYRYCTHLSRSQGRNFYYSFLCLPLEKRRAMYAIYAFMRLSDDYSDDYSLDDTPESRRDRMAEWRAALDRALEGDYGDSPVLPAFHDTVSRFKIPAEYFHAVIDGTEMDLEPRRFETWEESYRYCYHVASVVGLVCIHVWGFEDPAAYKLAEYQGIAFQWTNILRDLREDAMMGRVYLPQGDLRRFGYTEADLAAGVENEAFHALMRFQVERAREYYGLSTPLIDLISPECRPCLRAMQKIYRGILERIVKQRYDVFSQRARVSTWTKVWIAFEAWWQSRRLRREQVKGETLSSVSS